ncbi:AAA family ATPase [uncultured Hymenobacter sp.]|uniref:AAA family ATPase n=1 Tax=uncultured Hymenobacter sp. TaxID=170016 RepID=UPI0035CBC6B0
MLTRLHIVGFKNLVDTDVRFGPFTCIAGANGVGKSNLFDAIRFLSNLATYPLREAALMVRDEQNKAGDLRSLFTRTGNRYADTMKLEAEMIISAKGEDDLGQPATAKITFLRYKLELGYEEETMLSTVSRLVIRHEELAYINLSEAKKQLGFPHSTEWRKSVVTGRRTVEFISTEQAENGLFIRRHQEGPGQPQPYAASKLMRTVLSSVNAGEAATAALAKREMQSWQLLQLEPTALRNPDPIDAPAVLSANGLHLPATLYRLRRTRGEGVYARIGSRLAELNEDVRHVQVERDDKRDLLVVEVTDRSGTQHPARALSDGTLRFLALTVIEEDDQVGGVLCLEEPENGIHPARIAAMLDLLRDIVTDTEEKVEEGVKLRQVIINTHSPAVVNSLPADTLVIAIRVKDTDSQGQLSNQVHFAAVPETWRTKMDEPAESVTLDKLLAYLSPDGEPYPAPPEAVESAKKPLAKPRRLRDHINQQLNIFEQALQLL